MRHRSNHRRFAATSKARVAKRRIASLEALESRQMLSANPIEAALIDIHGPDMQGKDGPFASVGLGLSLLYHEHEAYLDQGPAEPFEPSSELFKVDKEGRVVVDLVVDVPAGPTSWQYGSDLQESLVNLGLEISGTWGAMVSGLLPISAIPQLAALEGIRSAMATAVVTNVGLAETQGDEAQRSDLARAGFGVGGSGITVGVLSDSYDTSGVFEIRAADDVASGDLPGPANPFGHTTPVNVLADFAGGTIDEGRAMLQLVHDVAPGANLAFHTTSQGQADFANGIVQLATDAGADVIVDDVIYFAEPMFQDGIIAQAVDEVVGMGVPYFSSAGNADRTSYESSFDASGELGPSGGPLHDFDPGSGVDVFQQVTIGPGATVILSFQWDDPFASVSGGPGAATDLDIFLLDAPSPAGDLLSASANFNIGGDPVEVLGFENSTGSPITAYLAIENFSGPDPSLMKYIGFVRGGFSIDEYDTHSSTSWGHSNAAGAEAVGAAPYFATPAFGVTPPEVESFSSVGGVPILFDTAGIRLATPDVRMKPEITAPDGGNTTFFFSDSNADPDLFPNFFGTSAAAPHAAAVAALMLDQAGGPGTQTPSQIYSNLETTAIDMDDPFTPGFDTGFDFKTGYGLIDANAAVLATPAGVPPLTEPFPVPLFPVDPLGGLIYDGSVDSDVSEVGDTDSFTIEVDTGQTISLAVESADSLQARVELLDPLGVSVGSATAPSPGAAALLQTVSATRAGTYTVVVSGVNSGTPGTPDFNSTINKQSSVFSPNVLDYSFGGLSAPGGDASLSAFSVADLADTTEFLTVEAEGIFSVDLFVGAGNDLAPRSQTVTIPAATMAALAANGIADFAVTPSPDVDDIGATQLTLQLAYQGIPADGTGEYTLELTLNAATEAESFGLGSNDSQSQAQDINASFIPLISDRGAAVGTLIGPNSFDPPAPIPVFEREPNNSRAGAQNLDGELWTVAPDPNIQDAETIPHVSILGSGDGTFDYYSFTVGAAGAEGIFDIDFANFDSELFLYDGGGSLLASNDDSVPADPGSASVLDAKIDFTFSSPGTYVIAVGEFDSEDAGGFVEGNTPDPGESYTLHVSIEDHPIDPGTPIPQDDRDFYRFDAVQGDAITLAATEVSGSADSMSLQLRDASGTVLASGSSGAGNVDRYIQDFEVPATATYFVRVGSTNDDVDYSLVITRDATFELGLSGAQNIDATDTVLGHVGESVAPIEVIEFDELPAQPLDGVSVKGATFDFKVNGADSDAATFGSIGVETAFLTVPFASGNPAGIVTIDFDTPTPIFGFAAALLTLSPVVTPGVTVTLLDEAATVIDTIDVTLFNEGFLFISEAVFSYTGAPITTAVLDFNESVAFEFGLDNVTFQGEQVVEADDYEISAEAGDVIQLATLTPAGGPFEFVNEIDPRIEVLDPNGNLVAVNDHGAADGRNAMLTFTAEKTASYTIRVTAAGSRGGEYVLHADRRTQPGVSLEDGVLRIVGTDKQDIIFVENGTSPAGTVEVRASFLEDIQTFSAAAIERIEVFGRDGWDRIFVTHPLKVPTLIDGGKGSDVLEAGSGPATLIGGQGDDDLKGGKKDDILDGGDGNDILTGRGGNDILIGGDGLDRIDGGGGRDILIGGAGPDQLGGSWGSDILIEGTTSYDQFYEALQLILAEWTASRSYLKRVDNIRSGSGPILGGTGLRLERGVTVFDDGTEEIELRGMQSRDWFFAQLNEIDDKQPNEERN